MKRKYVKLNDGYSHLSLGNVINVIKEESKNKSSAIQGEIFCAIFSVDYVNNSTVNNYCIGSRGIGDNYKQIYINLRKKFDKDKTVFKEIICNILTIVEGVIYSENDINVINQNGELKKFVVNYIILVKMMRVLIVIIFVYLENYIKMKIIMSYLLI